MLISVEDWSRYLAPATVIGTGILGTLHDCLDRLNAVRNHLEDHARPTPSDTAFGLTIAILAFELIDAVRASESVVSAVGLPEDDERWTHTPRTLSSAVRALANAIEWFQQLRRLVQLDRASEAMMPTPDQAAKAKGRPRIDFPKLEKQIANHLCDFPNATIKAVAAKCDVCTGTVSKTQAWKKSQLLKKQGKPAPKGKQPILVGGKKMQALAVNWDDPSETVSAKELLRRKMIERFSPDERAEFLSRSVEEQEYMLSGLDPEQDQLDA